MLTLNRIVYIAIQIYIHISSRHISRFIECNFFLMANLIIINVASHEWKWSAVIKANKLKTTPTKYLRRSNALQPWPENI